METIETLHLIDFAPLLQLAAGFFVMFIAIDITKSFSLLLSTHVYDFKGELANRVSKYKMDKECLELFRGQPHFQTGAGRKSLEETNNNIEELDTLLQQFQISTAELIDDECRCDTFRYLSIYMFIFCLLALFVAGLRKDELIWLQSMALFTCLSCLVVIVTVSFNHKLKKCNKYNQLCLIVTLIIVLVSVVASFFAKNIHLNLNTSQMIFCSDCTILMVVALPYLVFVIYSIIVFCHSLSIRKRIANIDNEVKEIYSQIQQELTDMRGYLNQENRELSLITSLEDCSK